MGHTTRCVSLIRQFIQNSNSVIFAGNDRQISFMQREFPQIQVESIGGYDVRLDSRKNTYMQVINQSAKIKRAIKNEYDWVTEFIRKNSVDVVVSDNRYGFRHDHITSIMLTHQLNLQIPAFSKTASGYLQRYINQFDYCWVPDSKENPLCGKLTDAKLKVPILHIGWLCRFSKLDRPKKYDRLAIVSGPEPERSLFVDEIREYLKRQGGSSAMVGTTVNGKYENIDCFLNPSTLEMERLVAESEVIISRAGYTTIMELLALEKQALLIPTKGQFEQEYLSKTIKNGYLTFGAL